MYSRSFVFLISILILAPFEAYAGTSTQTDWSGGDGIWGPVFDWGDEYYETAGIQSYTYPSNIVLQADSVLMPLEHAVDGDFTYAYSVYSADINGDGYMDILASSLNDYGIIWWENADGFGTSWTEHIVDWTFEDIRSIHAADINGDGDMDVLGAATSTDDIRWWENCDTGAGIYWLEHTVDGDFDSAWSVYSADINGDGYMDILGAASLADEITWWENLDGSGTSWTEHAVDGDFDGAVSVHSADVNGDGYMDVLGAANLASEITWWENLDGSGTSWTEHTVASVNTAWTVYSADINGDGYMDILGAGSQYNWVYWWENLDGSGISWADHIVTTSLGSPRSVYSTDINGDGDMDILGAGSEPGIINYWENVNGSGIYWAGVYLAGFDGAVSVHSADFNGDGYMDVLGAAYLDDDITWWSLFKFPSAGSLESSVLDVQESPDWQTIGWTCNEPSGTGVSFQVRASDNSSSMGAWSDTLTAPCTLEGILTDEDCYFQYRVILSTTDSLLTPVLQDVTVDWVPFTGTQEGSEEEVALFALYGAQPNPALGHATLVFSLPVDSGVELTVYDLTGRVVYSVNEEYSTGVHEVILEGLASGVYMVRMTSEELTATRQFVMIEK